MISIELLLGVVVSARALTSYYSKQTNYMGIFTVSGWCMFVARAYINTITNTKHEEHHHIPL